MKYILICIYWLSDVNILFYKFSKNLNYFDFEQTKIFYILGWRD